jgi:hypothetical protein
MVRVLAGLFGTTQQRSARDTEPAIITSSPGCWLRVRGAIQDEVCPAQFRFQLGRHHRTSEAGTLPADQR